MDTGINPTYDYWQSEGECDLSCGRHAEAVTKLGKALRIAEAFGESDSRLARSEAMYGMALLDARRNKPAISHLSRALALYDASPGTRAEVVLQILNELVEAQLRLARFGDAEPSLRRAADLAAVLHGRGSYQAGRIGATLGEILLALDRGDEAEPVLRQALMTLEADADPDVDAIQRAQECLGKLYVRQVRWSDAIGILSRRLALLGKARPRAAITRTAAGDLAAVKDIAGQETALTPKGPMLAAAVGTGR
jgi:tetratricopeptide (TPR) repeat protein